MKGFTPFVEFLAAHGADLYAKDANGRTPLELAEGHYEENFLKVAAEPHVDTVELLKKLMAEAPQTLSSNVSAAGSRRKQVTRRARWAASQRPRRVRSS